MTFIEANWVWLLIALVLGAGIIWWVWGQRAAPIVKQPEAPKPEPVSKAAEPAPAKAEAEPLAFTGEIPGPEPIQPKEPIDIIPHAAKPVAKAPAAKKVATKPAAAKAPAKKPAVKPKAGAKPDNLLQLKGVGPKLATLLGELGVTSFAQIAGWSAADVERIDSQLGNFKGRITRDKWIEQANYLAKGDVAGFEAKFGKLDSGS